MDIHDQIQSLFDTDGHLVYDQNGDETGSGIQLDQALTVADEADQQIAELAKEIIELADRGWVTGAQILRIITLAEKYRHGD